VGSDSPTRHGIPKPQANVHIQGLLVDFTWPGTRVVVEADSFEHHGTRQAFERDRHRDAILRAAGYRTARYTHRQLTRRPTEVKRALSALLSEPGRRLPTAPARAGARR
jgi:very-short-patch-repair endonuclease